MPLKPLTILLTTVGCPGGITMINALKNNGERSVKIIGTDMNPYAAGHYFVDKFYTVPAGKDPGYAVVIEELAQKESVDIIFPQSSTDVMPLSQKRDYFWNMGIPILIPHTASAKPCDNKGLMYQTFEGSDIPIPDFRIISSLEELIGAAHSLGYPQKTICFKPTVAKGSRGFRILSANVDKLNELIRKRVEDSTFSLEDCIRILEKANPFPDLLVSEFLEGREETVDLLCDNGEVLLGFPKTREAIKAGLAMFFRVLPADSELMDYARSIVKKLQYDYFINIQFKGGKLLEINPRVSTFIHQENYNIPYMGIKWALGEISRAQLWEYQQQLRSTRLSVRYYDQVFLDEDTT